MCIYLFIYIYLYIHTLAGLRFLSPSCFYFFLFLYFHCFSVDLAHLYSLLFFFLFPAFIGSVCALRATDENKTTTKKKGKEKASDLIYMLQHTFHSVRCTCSPVAADEENEREKKRNRQQTCPFEIANWKARQTHISLKEIKKKSWKNVCSPTKYLLFCIKSAFLRRAFFLFFFFAFSFPQEYSLCPFASLKR